MLKTTDVGDSWDRLPYNMIDVLRALVMFDDERGIIGANLGRFYRTTDNWNSFTTVILSGFGHAACPSFVDDQLGWAASESGRIARTTDGGATWTLQTSGTTNAFVALHFANDQLGFAAPPAHSCYAPPTVAPPGHPCPPLSAPACVPSISSMHRTASP
ncbi:MAG: hypothetical protein IPO05_15320 [Flavobacteriales bacterium]|nr:hypothetical protein [Flavobacteriales bacterium]MBP7448676.1 hypothetical protein [Flavobacteriales bacterium]